MKVTAKEIAEELGISTSSVSLAINGKPGVSEETRQKVLAQAAKMGYLSQKKDAPAATRNIRYVIFLENGDTVKETSFYSIVLQGIEAKATEHGYNVFVSYFYAGGNWAEQIAAICKDVSGIIILATEMEDRHIEKAYSSGLEKQSIPIVLVDNATSLVDVDCVVSDSIRGAGHAVAHLLAKGHPDVGYLRSKSRIDNFNQRQAGVVKARRQHGINDDTPLQVVDVGISSELAYQDMCDWLNAKNKPLSAYFTDNDIIAAACIRALKAKGYRVPGDVSIVGFDDMPLCTMVDPPLTTVRVMKDQLGLAAMEILHHRVQGEAQFIGSRALGVCRAMISTHLIERESVAPCSKRPAEAP